MRLLWHLLLLCGTIEWIFAVKIGISKQYTGTITTTTTTTPSTTSDPPTTESTEATTANVLTEASDFSTSNAVDILTLSDEPLTTTTPSSTTETTKATTSTSTTTKSTPPSVNKTKVAKKPKVFGTKSSTTTTSTTTSTTTESPDLIHDTKQGNPSSDVDSKGHSLNRYYCACNLLNNICDINCCCDPDCNVQAFKAFDCFTTPRTRLEDFQHQHGLPTCKINDGWLCVFRSNLKEKKQKIPNILHDTNTLPKWPSLMMATMQSNDDADTPQFYRTGQPLRLIDLETMEIRDFELPSAFINSRCLIQEPIKHLKTTRTICRMKTLEEMQQYKRDLLDIVSNYKLLRQPLPAQISLDSQKTEEYLLEIKLMRCLLSDDRSKCLLDKITDLEVENYYAIEIEVLLKHNFTALTECEVRLKESLVPDDRGAHEYRQDFVVKFIHFNGDDDIYDEGSNDDRYQQAISGPLGYLPGAPIIIAQNSHSSNESLETRTPNNVLNYFRPNATRLRKNHSLYLMSRRKGECVIKRSLDNSIKYGISELRQCNVRLENSADLTVNPTERNFTAICLALQRLALEQLVSHDEMQEIWISQLGKPENNTDQKWIPMQWRNVEFAPIQGVYNQPTHTFTCRNVLLNVMYEFQVGNFVEKGVAHQHLVKQAVLTYGQRHDLEFGLTELLELPLTVSVMFYDFPSILQERQLSSGARKETHLDQRLQYLSVLIISLVL